MVAAVVVLVPLAASEAGGISQLFSERSADILRLTHPPEFDTLYIAGVCLLMILAYSSINWALIQRYYCVPNEKEAIKMGCFVVILFLIGPPLILFPALVAPKFLSLSAEQDKMVYALVCLKLLPSGLMGLVIAAMFAATMSMLSSDYNVCAAVLTNDVYRRLVRPKAGEKELVLVGRLMTLVVGVVSLATALTMRYLGGEGLFRGMVKLFSIFTAPVAIPMILGLMLKRANKYGALSSFLSGTALGLTLFFLLGDQVGFMGTVLRKETVLLFSTTTVTFAVMILVSYLSQPSRENIERSNELLERLSIPIGRLEEDLTEQDCGKAGLITPFHVVGLSILLIGALMLAVLPFVERGLAFGMDLGVAVVLVLIGFLIMRRSEKAKPSGGPVVTQERISDEQA